jgi:hypothetical protein
MTNSSLPLDVEEHVIELIHDALVYLPPDEHQAIHGMHFRKMAYNINGVLIQHLVRVDPDKHYDDWVIWRITYTMLMMVVKIGSRFGDQEIIQKDLALMRLFLDE